MTVNTNLAIIEQKIQEACLRVNRTPDEVNLIAVTKYVGIETAQAAINSGIKHIGENREDGFLDKQEHLTGNVTWHYIGTLQSRKVKSIIDTVDYIHSLDRISLAKEIQKRSSKTVNCFVQVNISEENSKHGLSVADAVPFIKNLNDYPSIKVAGLMTMAPYTNAIEAVRGVFKSLKQLQLEVQALELPYAPCEHLSMGMSNDYEIAIEEGATFIRIGTSLVGKEF